MRRLLIATVVATLTMTGVAHAQQEPTLITITDDQVGTEAFERLLEYTNGGHSEMAGIISEANSGASVGVGFGVGSGGLGYRPNITLAIWGSGVDAESARRAVYEIINASEEPITTNGDCAIACDGSYVNQTTTTVAQTTVAQTEATTTTVVSNGAGGETASATTTGDLRVSPTTTDASVSQAGSGQAHTVSAPKRQSVKKCVKPLRGKARKCLTSRDPLSTLVLPTKGRTWTPTSRQEGKR